MSCVPGGSEAEGADPVGFLSGPCRFRQPSGMSISVLGPIDNELLNHQRVVVAYRATLELYRWR